MTREEQVWERERLEELQRCRDLTMEDLFTCKECGSHELQVLHTWDTQEIVTTEIACTCGEAPDGVAGTQTRTDLVSWEEAGNLNAVG